MEISFGRGEVVGEGVESKIWEVRGSGRGREGERKREEELRMVERLM